MSKHVSKKPKSDLVYGGRIPDGYLPAHNHVIHTPVFTHGENGFRSFWISPENVQSGKWQECPCGWQRKHRKWDTAVHYALSKHVEWWKAEIKKRGNLEAVYQLIEKRLQLSREHPGWDDDRVKRELAEKS